MFDDIGREPFASIGCDNAMSERLALESEANLKQAALRQQAIKEGAVMQCDEIFQEISG